MPGTCPSLARRTAPAGEPPARPAIVARAGRRTRPHRPARTAARMARSRYRRARHGRRAGSAWPGSRASSRARKSAPCCAMRRGVRARMALGILVPIQMPLELAVAFGDEREHVVQRAALGLQPALRDRCAASAHSMMSRLWSITRAVHVDQHRHRALGRRRQQFGRLVAQHHLAQFAALAARRDRHARAHRVRAAAERIQDRQRPALRSAGGSSSCAIRSGSSWPAASASR